MSVSDSQPFITTVVPTYRRPKLLRRALTSILAQTYTHFRVCVYDNASGDETGAVVDEFRRIDSRVEYVCRPTNIGMFANFADGAKRVETPFFSFLADDDLMLPNFYEDALGGFQRHPEAALSTLAVLRMRPSGVFVNAPVLGWPQGLVVPPNGVFSMFQYGDPGLQALLIRHEVWVEFGGFDEMTEPSADVDFQLRICTRLPIVVSRKIGAIGIFHGESTTVKTEFKDVWPGWHRLGYKFNQDTNLPPAARLRAAALLRRWMRRGLLTQGVARCISRGKWNDAEWAADLLVNEYRGARVARFIRGATAMCKRLPGSRYVVRALFALRASEKITRNLGLQWRFRTYAKFLRTSTVAASSMNFVSAARSGTEYNGIAHRLQDSHSPGKSFS